MNDKAYIAILETQLKEFGLQDKYIFQQDNDPKYTTYNTKNWLLYNIQQYNMLYNIQLRQLHTSPQSPDLNPIHLWSILEDAVRKRQALSRAGFIKIL